MSITQKYMKKVNAFDLIYFGGTNIILLCNIYVYKYIPLRNSFCESSSADLLTLQLFLKIHLYFTDAQPQPPHFVDLWPKTKKQKFSTSPIKHSLFYQYLSLFLCEIFFRIISTGTFSDHDSFHTQNVIKAVFHSFLYWTHLLFDIYVHCTSLQSSIEFSKKV